MAAARRMRRRGWMRAAREATQPETPRAAVTHSSIRVPMGLPVAGARAYIFDVEGTLVDTVLPSLNCWCRTLAEFGFSFRTADLHRYSGINARDALARLLPPDSAELHEFILSKYYWNFRAEVLPTVRSIPGARELMAGLKARGAKIALATTCDRDELAQYCARLRADDCVDACVSGEDVKRGKPHPEVVLAALARLEIHPSDAVFIGDTPYDAEAARHAKVRSFGVLSGHFPRADLLSAGCSTIFLDLKMMNQALPTLEAA